MFQLEEQLRNWKQQLVATQVFCRDQAEELESHVRDSMERLLEKGLDEQEAFIIATHRIGDQAALSYEYGKVNIREVWMRRGFWMLAGCLTLHAFTLLIGALASVGQIFTGLISTNGIAMSVVSLTIRVVCWLLLSFWLYRYFADSKANSIVQRIKNLNGFRLAGLFLALVIVAKCVQLASNVVLVRTMPLEEFGMAALILSGGQNVLAVLFPFVLLIALLKLRHLATGACSSVAT